MYFVLGLIMGERKRIHFFYIISLTCLRHSPAHSSPLGLTRTRRLHLPLPHCERHFLVNTHAKSSISIQTTHPVFIHPNSLSNKSTPPALYGANIPDVLTRYIPFSRCHPLHRPLCRRRIPLPLSRSSNPASLGKYIWVHEPHRCIHSACPALSAPGTRPHSRQLRNERLSRRLGSN